MENNLYIIYMPRVAAALRELGFKIVKVSPNQKKPQYDVYWFEDRMLCIVYHEGKVMKSRKF